MLNPNCYTSEKVWHQELETLFQQSWVFVGLLFELEGLSHNGVRVADKSIVIQCDAQGKPRAYLNVCSHRHAEICEAGVHQGALRCPYHGWSYDRRGVPVGIPHKEAFPQVIAAPEQFRLKEFHCESAGQFIFVRIADDGTNLRKYLGNQYEFLVRASQGMSGYLDEFREDVHANWKVVIENSLEGYHVPAVHSATFMQASGMAKEEKSPEFFLGDRLHSHLEHAAETEWVIRFQRQSSKIGEWPWYFEHYTHHFIFPNLTVTSFMGYSFHIQRFDPSAVDRTTVHSRTVGVKFKNANPAGKKMMEHIYSDGHDFTRKVFAEDGLICKKIQNGLQSAEKPAILAAGLEDRVLHFQRAYATVSK